MTTINEDTPICHMPNGKYKYISHNEKKLSADSCGSAEDSYFEWLLAVMQDKERGNFDGTRTTGYTK